MSGVSFSVPRTDTSLNSEEVDESVIPHASTMAQMRGLRGDTTARQPNSLFASTPRRTLDMSKAANSPVSIIISVKWEKLERVVTLSEGIIAQFSKFDKIT